jgi:hypothetical protein
MNSHDLALYIEITDGISKPWLLAQLRLQKLAEKRHELSPKEFEFELADIYHDVMNLGEWWKGREADVF